MGISTAIRSNAALLGIACAFGSLNAHAFLTPSYREMISGAPTLDQVRQYATNLPRSAEVISQSLYDHVIYPFGGRIDFELFSAPVGNGVSAFSATSMPKNFADTNMEAPKQLPRGVAHLVTGISVNFRVQAGTSNFSNQGLAFAAPGPDSNNTQNLQNWFIALREGAYLTFNVGSKTLLCETGLYRFPMSAELEMNKALATNSGTAGMLHSARLMYSDPYIVDPPILIPPEQNFSVRFQYIPARAMINASSMIIGVFLSGYRYRYSQ